MTTERAVILLAIAGLLGLVYVGGVVTIGSQPLFGHLDDLFNTEFFMWTHHKFMGLLSRSHKEPDDSFTRVYYDHNKVLEKTSE